MQNNITLKEKLNEKLSEAFANEIEKLTDEFAIGFAEWFADNTLRVDLDGYKTFGDTDETKPHTVKELLEIYKDEKDL
jgi:hypothetical protein